MKDQERFIERMIEEPTYVATRVALEFHPELLWARRDGARLIVPPSVVASLSKKRRFRELLRLASEQRRIVVPGEARALDMSGLLSQFREIFGEIGPAILLKLQMDPPEMAVRVVGEIAALVQDVPHARVLVESTDFMYYRCIGVECVDVHLVVDRQSIEHPLVRPLRRRHWAQQRAIIFVPLAVAIVSQGSSAAGKALDAIVQVLMRLHAVLSQRLAVSVLAVVALVVGSLFYQMRNRLRLVYGMLEIVVGVLLFQGGVPVRSESLHGLLSLVGGVYGIVRGMDNIGKWVRDESADWSLLRAFWIWAFGERF